MINKLVKIWHHFPKLRQKQFWLLLILMIIASLFEVISVGMILPFIGVLASPEQIYYHPLAQTFINFLQITDSSQLALPITIFFIFIILLTGLIRLILLYSLTRLSFATGADISIDIYRRNLYQEYSYHVSQNSSELINSIITKINICLFLSNYVTKILSICVFLQLSHLQQNFHGTNKKDCLGSNFGISQGWLRSYC